MLNIIISDILILEYLRRSSGTDSSCFSRQQCSNFRQKSSASQNICIIDLLRNKAQQSIKPTW